MKGRPQTLTKSNPLPKSWAAVVASGGDNHVNTHQQPAKQALKRTAPETPAAGTSVNAMNIDTHAAVQTQQIVPAIPLLSLQEQIAQAVAAALQPLMGLTAQVQTLQEEITAMRAVVDVSDDEEEDVEGAAVSFPSAVPPQRASHTAGFSPY